MISKPIQIVLFSLAFSLLSGCGKGLDALNISIIPDFYYLTSFVGSYTLSGSIDSTGSSARFDRPSQMTELGDSLYVTDRQNHTIRKVVKASGVVTTIAGSAGLAGSVDGTGTAALFRNPDGIATDGTYLYIADSSNHAVRRLDPATGIVVTIAGSLGTSGSTDAAGTSARFKNPTGMDCDGSTLYIADFGNHTVRKLVISGAVVTTLAGNAGTTGTTNGTSTETRFYSPYGVKLAGTSTLYVSEVGNHTVRKVLTADGTTELFVGKAGTAGSVDGVGENAQLNVPSGLAIVGESLYIADNGNHQIRRALLGSRQVFSAVGKVGTVRDADGEWDEAATYAPMGLLYTSEGMFVSNLTSIRKLY